MFQPDLYSLQLSKSINKVGGWIPHTSLQDLLSTSSFQTRLKKTVFDNFIKFDIYGLLNIKLSTKAPELSELQIEIRKLIMFIDTIEQLKSSFILTSSPNTSEIDYQLFLAKIYQDFKNKQSDKFIILYTEFKKLKTYNDNEIYEYLLSQLENIYTSSLAYENYPKLIENLRKLIEIFEICFRNFEDINEYHEIWLLYKAFMNLAGEVYSYVDDVNLSGFLITPNITSVNNKIKELEKILLLLPSENDLKEKFNTIKEYLTNPESFASLMKNLTKIYPSDLESIYNLAQFFQATDDLFPGTKVRLIHKGEEYDFNVGIFKESLALDDLADTLDNFDSQNINEQVLNTIENLMDFYGELTTLILKGSDYKILSSIVNDIIKAVKQIFLDLKINIFTRANGISISDAIYFINDDFPLIYEGLSGNFDLMKLDSLGEFNISSLIESLSLYFKTKISICNKLKDSNYLNSLKDKRIEFYLRIINKEFEPNTTKSDHEDYLKRIIDYSKAAGLKSASTISYETLDFGNIDFIADILFTIGNEATSIAMGLIFKNELQEKSFENIQFVLAALGQLSVTPDFDFTNKKFNLNVDKQTLMDYLRGYYSYSALENKYNIRNLLSFGLMKGVNVE